MYAAQPGLSACIDSVNFARTLKKKNVEKIGRLTEIESGGRSSSSISSSRGRYRRSAGEVLAVIELIAL